jgi:hypothetical protein
LSIRFFCQYIFELFFFWHFSPCLFCKLANFLRIKIFSLFRLFFFNKLFFKMIKVSFRLFTLIFRFCFWLKSFFF